MSNNRDDYAISTITNAARTAIRSERVEQLMQSTRNNFRQNFHLGSSPRTGRRRSEKKNVTLFLLRRSNVDYYPTINECTFLQQNGCGKKKAQFKINWALPRIQRTIYDLYATVLLEVVGFRFGKCGRDKRINILSVNTFTDLMNQIPKGQVLLIPNRDLNLNTLEPTLLRSHINNDEQNLSNDEAYDIELDSNLDNDFHDLPLPRLHVLTASQDVASRIRPLPFERERRSDHTLRDSPRSSSQSSHLSQNLSNTDSTSDFNFSEMLFGRATDLEHNEEENETIFEIEEIAYPELLNHTDDNIEVIMKRENVLEEMFKLYDNESVVQRKIKVSFENELGLDYGGLTKELFSEFWKSCTLEYFRGENRSAPFLPLAKIRKGFDEKFCLIGRILAHNLILTKTIPTKICKFVYLKLGSLDKEIPKSILQDDFFNFLTSAEQCLLRKAKFTFDKLTDCEREMLQDLFSTYGLLENPKSSEIEDQILTIAENVLCKESYPFIKKIKDGIPLFCEDFFNNLTESKITYLFKKQSATASKIIEILQTSPEQLNNLQTRIIYFFKTYLMNLSDEKFDKMLLFMTGSTNMPEQFIISFKSSGYPVAHTCSNTLEIASTYSSYQEIKMHFDGILDNDSSFEYTFY